mmetsp:Transcript_20498/g.20775  ORF Transcript_20498/g.20775 Transcript_20498/m.20775 type:complete len:85 (-) Transcript_20498:377-631(-)
MAAANKITCAFSIACKPALGEGISSADPLLCESPPDWYYPSYQNCQYNKLRYQPTSSPQPQSRIFQYQRTFAGGVNKSGVEGRC